MSGERDLNTLRSRMAPNLHWERFVYCCLSPVDIPPALEPIATFREAEGLTAIVPKQQAESLGIGYQFECAMVTLDVHSSLDAVGLMAMVSTALAEEQIPCNVVSAYYHDHLFVPFEERERVMRLLHGLAGIAGPGSSSA